jgi:hypothetical protein
MNHFEAMSAVIFAIPMAVAVVFAALTVLTERR